MATQDDLQRGYYMLRGAVQIRDTVAAGAQQNLHQGTAYDLQPTEFSMSLQGQPVLVTGIKATSTTVNAVTGVNVTTDGNGNNRLMVDSDAGREILTPSAPTAASVGVASAQALAANTAARHRVFVNTSGNNISLGFGANAAVLNSGITLMPNGGSYEMSETQGNLYKGIVNAIAGGAASNLSIQEDA